MKHVSVLFMNLAIVVGFNAQARVECFVLGQELGNVSNYNKLLQYEGDVKIEASGATYIYQTDTNFVVVSKTSENKLSVTSGVFKPEQKYTAAATGGGGSVSLVDGTQKIAILCSEK